MRIVVVGVLASSLLGLRGAMVQAMVSAGHEVLALAPEDDPRIRAGFAELGAAYGTIPLRRTSVNPFRDAVLMAALVDRFRRFRADAVFVYAAKPVVYGLLAARVAGVPLRTAMITGQGSAFAGGASPRRRGVSSVLKMLYRIALRQAHVVFFHNRDDERAFRARHLIGAGQRVVTTNGSGVDLQHYALAPLPGGPVTFLMMGRLLRDKGVTEYVDASRIVRDQQPEVRCQLLGMLDSNPTAVSADELDRWQREGAIEYVGAVEDVRPVLAGAHVGVLPSYGEGMPRSLLEAMAMGRPILTTDVPGCRDTVEIGRNGWLVPARDAEALAAAMLAMVRDVDALPAMGQASRRIAEARYDIHLVNRTILSAMGIT